MKKAIFAILMLGCLHPTGSAAFSPSENSNGIRWVSASGESWSGSAQSRADGASLHLVGAFDGSLDTTNSVGVTAYLGQLEPIEGPPPATPTPTPTGGLPATATPTPSTTCNPDFNLDGLNDVDARDLLVLLAAIRAAGAQGDLNCDGAVNGEDLLEFSGRWRE